MNDTELVVTLAQVFPSCIHNNVTGRARRFMLGHIILVSRQ